MSTLEQIEKQARLLAMENKKSDQEIRRIFWFKHDAEVRLVEVHESLPPSEDNKIHPVFFRASAKDGLPAPSGIALINEVDVHKAEPPEDWGTWDDAVEIH